MIQKASLIYADNTATIRLSRPALGVMLLFLQDNDDHDSAFYSFNHSACHAFQKVVLLMKLWKFKEQGYRLFQ